MYDVVDVVDFFDDPELWKAVAFIISVGAVILPIYHFLLQAVRRRSGEIANQMEEALKLRREAEQLLKTAQGKDFHKNAERKKILRASLKDARVLKQKADQELQSRLANKKEEILDRVQLIRHTGLAELKEKVVSVAVNTTARVLQVSSDKKEKQAFMDVGLQELEHILNQKEQKDKLLEAIKEN